MHLQVVNQALVKVRCGQADMRWVGIHMDGLEGVVGRLLFFFLLLNDGSLSDVLQLGLCWLSGCSKDPLTWLSAVV